MAKSARSSVVKRNNAKLRSTVFGPAADARTERLSAKLQELASLPKSTNIKDDASMEVEAEGKSASANPEFTSNGSEAMDVEMNDSQAKGTTSSAANKKKKANKNEKKKLHRKAKNSITFQKPGKSGKHRVSKRK